MLGYVFYLKFVKGTSWQGYIPLGRWVFIFLVLSKTGTVIYCFPKEATVPKLG